tara:strand:+ start:791 stop:937 length:147 start_codon:yes stop_codon:yes gene_type:complete
LRIKYLGGLYLNILKINLIELNLDKTIKLAKNKPIKVLTEKSEIDPVE